MDLKKVCLEENKKLSSSGLVVLTWGNISIRDGDMLYIKPSGVSYNKMKEDDISVVSLKDGSTIEGKKPSVDLKTHIHLYKNFSNIKSVAHTHSKFCTSFAQASIPIECIGTTHADYFYGQIPVTDHLSEEQIEEDYETNTGVEIVKKFSNKKINPKEVPGVLVKGHGVFSWGEKHEDAFKNAFIMEQIAEMYYYSISLNDNITLPDYILNKHYERKHGVNAYYGQR
jgi:L-ribulose-5-phosphate 4-epimerase